jgi:hypothetical protein
LTKYSGIHVAPDTVEVEPGAGEFRPDAFRIDLVVHGPPALGSEHGLERLPIFSLAAGGLEDPDHMLRALVEGDMANRQADLARVVVHQLLHVRIELGAGPACRVEELDDMHFGVGAAGGGGIGVGEALPVFRGSLLRGLVRFAMVVKRSRHDGDEQGHHRGDDDVPSAGLPGRGGLARRRFRGFRVSLALSTHRRLRFCAARGSRFRIENAGTDISGPPA